MVFPREPLSKGRSLSRLLALKIEEAFEQILPNFALILNHNPSFSRLKTNLLRDHQVNFCRDIHTGIERTKSLSDILSPSPVQPATAPTHTLMDKARWFNPPMVKPFRLTHLVNGGGGGGGS